jgi:hypothetical protein
MKSIWDSSRNKMISFEPKRPMKPSLLRVPIAAKKEVSRWRVHKDHLREKTKYADHFVVSACVKCATPALAAGDRRSTATYTV